MTVSQNRNIAIVGVGSLMSKSLAVWLASLGWNIALVSRSEKNLAAIAEDVRHAQNGSGGKVVYRAADASDPAILKATLNWCTQELGGKLDVLSYNAARVAVSHVTELSVDELLQDFSVSALGTLVAGQWFSDGNANVGRIEEGEWPLLLVTGGALDREPVPALASLSTVKAASQTISRLLAKDLPAKSNILVGMPLITGRVVSPGDSEYHPNFDADKIISQVFKPFFEDRERQRDGRGWTVERVH